jgi:DNA-3-methyladenine glycosylase II
MGAIDYARAGRLLTRRDPVIGMLIKQYGACGLASAQRTDPFHALVHAIIAQQLSTKAAATIERRFAALCDGGPTPTAVASLQGDLVRAAGVSSQKWTYLKDLSARVMDGSLALDSLECLPDEDVISVLTKVKGIGRWTAEMFLMFRLHRPDVLPVGDFGIVRAVKKAYKLRTSPSPARLTRIGEVACWYLWASLDSTPLEGGRA